MNSIKAMSHESRHRLIVAAITGFVLFLVATVGLPGAPENSSFGIVLMVAIVALYGWVIVEPPVLLISAMVGAVLLAISAPPVLATMMIVSGMLIVIGIPALIGISIGLGKGRSDVAGDR